MNKLLTLKIENNIAYVGLNRVDKKNAMSFAMLKELISTANTLKKDRKLRAIIIFGHGGFFSAGIDLNDLHNPQNAALAAWELLKPTQNFFQKAFLIWKNMPVPVICALEGYCFGAGMQLALGADFRISHPDCQLSIMEGKWGLIPDMGLTQTLGALMPIDQAKALTFSAKVFNGQEAKNLGLVTELSENPLQRATELAQSFTVRSPDAVLAAKRLLNQMALDPQKALRLERLWQLKLILGKNSRKARAKASNPSVEFNDRQFN